MKKSASEKMDTTFMKERNYRMVENLRRENKRAQKRLDEVMYSKQGVEASKKYHVDAVTKEQIRIRKELAKIRQTTSTTWGVLPPRDGAEPKNDEGNDTNEFLLETLGIKPKPARPAKSKRDKKKQKLLKMKTEETKKTVDNLKQFNDIFPTSSPTNTLLSGLQNDVDTKSQTSTTTSFRGRELSIADMNVTEAKDLVNKRLLASEKEAIDGGGTESPRPHRTLTPIDEKKVLPLKPESIVPSDLPRQWGGSGSASKVNTKPDPIEVSTEKEEKAKPATKAAPVKKKEAKTKKADGSDKAEDLVFDGSKYNPDGSLRMQHQLPDFNESLDQALRARYVRNKFKQWFERELTVGQIFSDDERYDAGNVKLYTVKANNIGH